MKIKTFILTFLMMMSSPFLFGQHWTDPGDTGYNQSMSLLAQIFLDDDVQEGNYEVAAFYNDELLGVGQIVPLTGTTSNYHVHLNVQGNTTLNGIYFKFFNGTNEYVSSTEMSFTEGLKGSHSNYEPINFYSVAQIGDVVYPSLQKAINACKEGDNTIELLADNAEDVTIKQVEGVNVTIDGGTSRYDYSGTITIHGNARHDGAETLTFQNINFTTNEAGHYFIDSNSTGSVERYAHNVTVSNCNFTATGDGVNSAVAMRIRQGFDIAINGGTFTNLHSALQAYGNAGITVSGITLTGKNGISAGTSTGVVIEDTDITATGYGVRADGTGAYDMTLKGTNTITAELPVVVRNTTGAYKLTVESGTYTALNSNPAVTFTTGDDGTFVAPTSPATAYLADGISTFGFEAKIGTVYHTTFVNAYAAAAAGDVITLLKDQNFSEIITLDKAITLDGGNYKLTSTAGRAINVDCAGEVTIKNLTIVGSTGCERGINIIEQAGITNIENVTISGQSHYAVHMATSAGAAKVNVKNSNLTGYGAFVVYGKGSVNTIENSTLVGINTYDDNGSNNFGTIVADVENTTITVTDGNITAKAEEGKAGMAIFTGKNGNNANVTLNSTLALEGAAKYTGILNETTTLKVKAEYATAIQAEGFATSDPDNGLVKVEGVAVAKIGETKYATLAKAITAAQANDVIVLLADITENVTVNKSLTIDGKAEEGAENNTFTGNMNATANITIKNINFDGKGYNGYAVETRSASVVVIEDCTAKNYGYGFLQIASNNHTTTVKNVTISNVNYGVKVDYSNGVVLENVDINAAVAAVLNSNYGEKTITIKNSELSILGTWERDTNLTTTYLFEGNNTIGQFVTEDALDIFKLTKTDATLTAPEGKTVTTDISGYVVKYEDGKYIVVGANVQVKDGDEVKGTFATLAEAITAAQASNTIVLLADITEDVTVNKNLTIDGGDKNYTGTMTISNGKTVTVQNVNFVKGCIDKSKGTSGTLTVKDCTFDGVDGSINYAVTMRGGNTVTIEGGDVKNYGYGMLYVPSAVSNVTVKGTEVDGVNYGVHVVYGSKVNIENVTMTNMAYGIMTQNYGAKTITIKNSSISGTNPIYVWERNTTVVDTFKFEGANTFSGLPTSTQAKLVLAAADATLTAPEGYNVTSGVDNLEVIYKNGCYSLYGLSGSGAEEEPFLIYNLEDLKFFRDHVNAGKTRYNTENVYVALAANIDMATEDWSVNIGDDCNNTFDGIFDGKGYTISNLNGTETAQKADGYVCTGLFGAIYGNAVIKNLTIENVNINTAEYTGNNAAAVVGFVYGDSGKTNTIENVTVKGDVNINASGVYGVGAIVGYSYNQGTLNIKSCAVEANDESAITAVSGSGAIIGYCGGKATIDACSVQNIDITAKGLVGGIAGITENSVNKVLSGNTVKDVTLTATKTEWVNSTAIAVGTMDGNGLTVSNTIFDNVNASRMVGSVYAEQPTYVVPAVEARIENKYYGTFDAALAAAQEGNTITVLAPVVITEDKTYDLTGLTVAGENVYPIFRIQNGANVVVANGNISNDDYVFVLGASDGSSAGNLTIESGVYTGTTTVASVTKGLLTINGGEFKVNASEYGATYMINCIDANYNDDLANVEIYGGKFYGFNPEDNVAEGANTNFCAPGYAANEIETGVYEVVAGNVLNQTTGNKYATLQAAVSAAQQGNTIELLKDITEDVTVDKSLTIDGKNNTYTGKMKMTNKADITVTNVNFDGKGYNGYAIESRGAYYITVEDCTAKNYGYGFIQLASGNVLTTIKDVTVSNMNYGVKVDYSNEVVLENVDINCAVAAVLNSNYGTKTITIKDSYLSILGIWTRNNTIKTTYVFEGENSIDDFVIDAAIDNFKLADVNSTLAAPNEITVTTDMEGYEVEYKDGKYIVVANKVELVRDGESQGKFATIQAAIDAAQANDVIVLLKDITENVTITKDLTIDGKAEGATANSKYTGTMTVNAKLNVTVQDIDFDKGCINDPGDAHGYLTIKNCNFDGVDKSIGYAVTVRGGDKLTIENSTAKNYSTGMLYIPSSVANIVIKDVEVSNVAAAFNITYSGDGTFENVKVDNVTYGIHFQIFGSRTYTVKNCDLKGATNPFWFWDKSNNTAKVTVVFEGNNDLGTKGITVNAGELQLATDATLTAAEGLNIKATEEGYVVEYNEGVYSVVPGNIALERNGEIVKKFATIQDAIDAAENGDEIVVLKDITLGTGETREYTTTSGGTVSVRALNLISGKSVTIDLNGNTLYCEEEAEENQIYNFFAVTEEGHLTIKDSSEDGTGTVEIKNNDVDATTVHSLIMCYNGTMTIENGNYKLHYGKNGNGMIYSQQSETVTVNGGNFWLGNVGTLENHSPWIFNASGRNGNRIIVNGGTFNDDVLHQYYAFEVESSVKNALVNNNDGTWSVITNGAVAHVTERYVYPANYTTNYTNTVGYATLKDAFAAAHTYNYVTEEEMSTVTMLKDVTLDAYVTISKSVNLNLGQFNITRVDGTALYFNGEGIEVTIDGEGTVSGTQAVYVDNGTVTINGGNYVGGYEAVYVINNGHAVINGGTFGAENDEDDTDFVLNEYDATRDVTTIAVYGGTFHGFNPENNAAEGAGTNFCAEGYGAVETAAGSNIWVVMPVQKQSLVAGWNWYSSYLKIKSEDLLLALGTNGSAVVSDNGGGDAYYDESYGWDNSLTENLDLSKMYMIETSIACDLNLAGELADASTITITLNPGWNWIGYPSNVETRISDAFSETPENGDVIKTKANSFAEYYAGQWYDGGVDMTMEPTKGYMYYNASNVTKTFTYNIVPVRGTNETIAETHYSVDYTKYPFNMTMVAVVDGAMNDNYEVAALVNGEVRGSTRPVYIESMDAYMLFLSINGDAVEEMTFKYYDLTTGEEYDLVNRIDYSNNAMIGSVNEPYVLSRGTTGIGDATMSQVNIYPNPTTTGTEINLQTVCDTVEVFNALGVKVAEYQNVDSIDALETAGIYVIRITNDGNVQNCRLVVK